VTALGATDAAEGEAARSASAQSSAALLRRVLAAHAAWAVSGAAGVAEWRWQRGDVVLLDNRRCVHRATRGAGGHRRELERVLADACWA
jgi:alpha-ketoglutarate-dependent taurine dioxygenase